MNDKFGMFEKRVPSRLQMSPQHPKPARISRASHYMFLKFLNRGKLGVREWENANKNNRITVNWKGIK